MRRTTEKFKEQEGSPYERTVETVEDPAPPERAIGYSITVNVGPVHQMVAQLHVGEDEDDEAINAKLDRVFVTLDRRGAMYEVEALEEERLKHQQAVDQYAKDWKEVDARVERAVAGLDVQVLELQQRKSSVTNKGAASFQASGKQGSYRPSGQTEQSIKNIEAAMDGAKKDKEKLKAEGAVEVANFKVNVAKFETAVAEMDRKIAAKRKLFEG